MHVKRTQKTRIMLTDFFLEYGFTNELLRWQEIYSGLSGEYIFATAIEPGTHSTTLGSNTSLSVRLSLLRICLESAVQDPLVRCSTKNRLYVIELALKLRKR